ncbi:hypothetical protein [Kitasatospora purpeofusca]|uniref:hypothetical protein n=1 Tax=Kitasatospora purpeofusca TaxID=67352 RepID=UPI0036B82561
MLRFPRAVPPRLRTADGGTVGDDVGTRLPVGQHGALELVFVAARSHDFALAVRRSDGLLNTPATTFGPHHPFTLSAAASWRAAPDAEAAIGGAALLAVLLLVTPSPDSDPVVRAVRRRMNRIELSAADHRSRNGAEPTAKWQR